ncbi:UDP-N-acetylglucosamine--N-acetylmuramyl-(pentapeptide) pyrophosphoryl-undecaprenol N-acetylglucosamine transferase [Abditibacteriota bacterium]|nr:UDP-N-acetylglucosamine--N-acetylmuramyl-(pentapeptide) pyrophosphoryl-undecaprenol N-acetylglucosamine transferase [Abditibacteriota bacterium]
MTEPSSSASAPSSSRPLRILVTGGGTAGHISPALALISTLRELEPSAQFQYVGSHGGMERKQVEGIKVPFVAVSTGKLRRYFSLSNLADWFRVPLGIVQSLAAIRRFNPDVVLATGGYVAVPPVVAAGLLKIPILIHEQTTQVGLANRICARFASRIALSWEAAANALEPKLRAKAWVAGNPVRPQIFGGVASKAVEHFGLSDEFLPVVYITGGSLGARVINLAVEECLSELVQLARVVHQCGAQENESERDSDRLTRARLVLPDELQRRYAVTAFIKEELRDVFELADLVVGRAGAGTVTELCALGKAALYVPLVPTGGDEQTKNARMAESVGAARVLKQDECDGPHLLEAVRALLSDKMGLKTMEENAKTLARPNAAREIARAVLELGRKTEWEEK